MQPTELTFLAGIVVTVYVVLGLVVARAGFRNSEPKWRWPDDLFVGVIVVGGWLPVGIILSIINAIRYRYELLDALGEVWGILTRNW